MHLIATITLAAALAGPVAAQEMPAPTIAQPLARADMPGPDYAAILASPIRTDADRARDEARHTALTLEFMGVRPGWKVVDMVMGGGYFTRTFSAAVGPEGHVTAWQPQQFLAFQESYRAAADAAAQMPNVDVIRSPIDAPELSSGVDLVFTAQNYHDLHLTPFPDDTAAKVNAAVFAALKPGGVYVIIDHGAAPGAGLSVVNSLHRIESEEVTREVEAAGFQFLGASAALWNDEDPRTANVFDASIRGKTDQFTLMFRKPE